MVGKRGDKREAVAQRPYRVDEVPFDEYYGDQHLRAAIDALADGDRGPFTEIYPTRPWSAFVDRRVAANVPLDVLRGWAESQPSAWTQSIYAEGLVHAAWEVRGRAFAKQVDANDWKPFADLLTEADTVARRAVALYPESPMPWRPMINVAKGLSLGIDECRARFMQLHARSPFDPDGCNRMLQALCQKWGGSHDEMFGFARWVVQSSAPNSPARGVISQAHFEYAVAGSDDPARYLARLGTAEEQVTAVEGLLLEPTADPEVVEALNWFAYTVVPIDTASSRVSRRVFSLLVDRPAEYPWIQLPWGIPYSFAATRYERSIAATRFPPVWSNW